MSYCKKTCTGTGNICQVCDDTTGKWKNVADGENKQSDGRCCIGGVLKYDATLCPASYPKGYTKTACQENSQYAQVTETIVDGTTCYQCADCPRGNEKPTNACYTEVTTPANSTTGCSA